jgi:hypothetical protein
VPTEYTTRFGAPLETSQYSVSEYAMPLLPAGAGPGRQGRRDPFVDLVYDLSPIVMRIHQSSLAHFLVRLCAVVGGALSVTRLADGLVHGAVRALGLAADQRVASCGGVRGSGCGERGRHRSSYVGDEMLPMRTSNPGSSHRGSMAGSLVGSIGRNSSSGGSGGVGGRGSACGSGGGGGGGVGGFLPTHAASSSGGGSAGARHGGGIGIGGGAAPVQMSSLAGFAPPALAGFGSWSQLDGGAPPAKKL